jgi:hypothetical protein
MALHLEQMGADVRAKIADEVCSKSCCFLGYRGVPYCF